MDFFMLKEAATQKIVVFKENVQEFNVINCYGEENEIFVLRVNYIPNYKWRSFKQPL